MKVLCKYADCDKDQEIDTKRDAYFFIGTGASRSFAHYACSRKHTRMMIPMDQNQIRGLQELIRSHYDLDDRGVPVHILDVYNVLGNYV